MSSKVVAIILLVVSAALGGGLLYRHDLAARERAESAQRIAHLSNELERVKEQLEEQRTVNLRLQRDFISQNEELKAYSNHLASAATDLRQARTEVKLAEESAKAASESAKAEMLKRDAQIAELEAERDHLSARATELRGSINDLESSISETEDKLKIAEGDRELLLRELKRLQTEKAELERQFNDIAVLREQVRKLRDELSIARRLEWIRRGLYGGTGLKGAERLQRGFANTAGRTNFNLSVELNRDGSARVIPPAASAASTNFPAVR